MHETAAPSGREGTAAAASSEYRHFGDDSALLTVAVHAHAGELPGDARLLLPGGGQVVASAVTYQRDAGLARLVFAVERGVASANGASLRVAIGADLVVTVSEPVKRLAIGVPDGELEHAVAAGVAGDELAGLIRMLERRCTIAERVAADSREERSDATKLAQAYREIWEVRELLQSREEVYARSAEAVEAAEAAQALADADAAGARAELEDVRAEAQAATARLEDDAAAQAERVARLEAELAAAVARGEEIEGQRDEARAVAARLEGDVEEALGVADEAHAELERARDAALAEVEAIKHDLAEASANVAAWSVELEDACTRAADAEALLEAERTLHEARLAARVGSERRLADLFAEAQRERLRRTPVDDQRAQVDALERQLERIKQWPPARTAKLPVEGK